MIIALAANLVIAVAKLIAGLLSRSSGMLAEAAHSLADSINELLLAFSLRRAKRPADDAHPLGHGREPFLWAFVAAIASFLIGGCASIALAVHELQNPEPLHGAFAAWIVLAIAFAADGASWIQSMRQARSQAAEYNLGTWRYLRNASDPIVRAVVVEDSVALLGVLFAAGGLLLSHIRGNNVPDAIASLLIGGLLAVAAFGLARPLADFLIGRSLAEGQLQQLHKLFEETPEIGKVLSLRALYTGPEEVVVITKIRPAAGVTTDHLAAAIDDLVCRIRVALPLVADVFVHLTKEDGTKPARDGR